jgi:Fe-S cluster biosynthesis and repair protein YggX
LKIFQRTYCLFTSKDHCPVHQLFIVPLWNCPSLPQKIFGVEIFNPRTNKSSKMKYHLLSPKPQKLPVIRYLYNHLSMKTGKTFLSCKTCVWSIVVIVNNKINLNQKKKKKKNLPMPSFLIKSKHDQPQGYTKLRA